MFLVLAAAASSAPRADEAARATACADVVRYRGTLYEGTFVGRAPRRGARAHGVRPGCNDTPTANEPAVRVSLAQVVGVSPALAVLAADNVRHV